MSLGTPFLHQSQALSSQTLNMILLLINHNGKCYHESQVHVHVTYAIRIDTILVKMFPLIFILHNVHVAALTLTF